MMFVSCTVDTAFVFSLAVIGLLAIWTIIALVFVVGLICASATSDLWQAGEKSKKER